MKTTLPQLLAEVAETRNNQTALRHKKFGLWHDISWEAYAHKARLIALGLKAMGLKKGQSISILGDNCPEWVFIELGAISAGGISAGIYATSAATQVKYVINHSESIFLFVENEEQLDKWLRIQEQLPKLTKVFICDLKGLASFHHPMVASLDELIETGRIEDETNPELFKMLLSQVKPEDTALLVYTSGTTGPPKGAMLSHINLLWMAEVLHQVNPFRSDDEVLSFLPLCHIFEKLFSVIAHTVNGYIVNFSETPDTVVENMREISPSVGYGVPRVWEKYQSMVLIRMKDAQWFKRIIFHLAMKAGFMFAKKRTHFTKPSFWIRVAYFLAYWSVLRKLKERLGFDRIRVAYSGAAPISKDVLSFFQAMGMNLVEGYGQTEGTGVSTLNPMNRPKVGTVGLPLPGLDLKIAADQEILVRSPGVFLGYFKNPEATKECLDNGWLFTGDLGQIDQDGYLKIIDRKKDIIVTAGGKNIAPQFIENKLKSSPFINDAVVIGDRRRYMTCLIMIDEENVIKYAQDHKIQFSTYQDLTQESAITSLIQVEIDQVNQELSQVETIKKFRILPKKLFEEDGEVTPTMKIKRQQVHQAFSTLIEEMYA